MRDFDIDFDADSSQPEAGEQSDAGIAGRRVLNAPGGPAAAPFIDEDDELEPTIVRGRE